MTWASWHLDHQQLDSLFNTLFRLIHDGKAWGIFLEFIVINVLLLSSIYSISQEICTRFCFTVLCCGYTLTDFPISIRLTSLALWQSNDSPSASKATLMNMDKYFMWIHHERLHNHNKAKPCAYFLGYTVCWMNYSIYWVLLWWDCYIITDCIKDVMLYALLITGFNRCWKLLYCCILYCPTLICSYSLKICTLQNWSQKIYNCTFGIAGGIFSLDFTVTSDTWIPLHKIPITLQSLIKQGFFVIDRLV